MVNRKFKLWHYSISHAQMLIRSIGHDKNIDIYFGGVKYMEIPSILDDISIIAAEKCDKEYLCKRLECVNDKEITVLLCSGRKYYVVASIMKIMENNLGMFELPFDLQKAHDGIIE